MGFGSYIFIYIDEFRIPENRGISLSLNGRGERIRTSDPLVPNQVRYQTALRPEIAILKWMPVRMKRVSRGRAR